MYGYDDDSEATWQSALDLQDQLEGALDRAPGPFVFPGGGMSIEAQARRDFERLLAEKTRRRSSVVGGAANLVRIADDLTKDEPAAKPPAQLDRIAVALEDIRGQIGVATARPTLMGWLAENPWRLATILIGVGAVGFCCYVATVRKK